MFGKMMLSSVAILVAAAPLFANPPRGRGNEKASDVEAALKLQQVSRTALPATTAKTVSAMTDAGMALQRAVVKPNEDATTSPFSITSAFGLVLNGVRGRTLNEVSSALFGGQSVADFNQGYTDLSARLRAISKDNVISFGNAVFVDRDFVLNDEYVRQVERSMGARAEALNFRNADETVARINGYIEEQTRQMIKNMISSPPERAALVNAGYFKGAWDFKFDVKNTIEQHDFRTGRETKKLPMMFHREKTFLYHKGDGFQMASLAYKNGDFAMDLIVPDQAADAVGAVRKVQEQLTGENYRRWIAAARPQKIVLGLPRFETKYKQEMTDYFAAKLPVAFSNLADFGVMTRERVAIDSVIHATVLKVNEEGTEGAFATVIGIRATSVVIEPPTPEVIADRPFLMVIRHTATGTPIFVSTIYDPKPMARPAN